MVTNTNYLTILANRIIQGQWIQVIRTWSGVEKYVLITGTFYIYTVYITLLTIYSQFPSEHLMLILQTGLPIRGPLPILIHCMPIVIIGA